jgi:ketosteroid isomerase-like protein
VPGSRVEKIKRGYDAWNSGNREFVLEQMSDDIEWITPPEDPEPGHFRGRAEVQRFWDQWRAAVGQLRFDVLEATEIGDSVIVIARRSGVGEQSGLSVSDQVAQVFTFAGDLCVRVAEFYDAADARAAIETATSPASSADA